MNKAKKLLGLLLCIGLLTSCGGNGAQTPVDAGQLSSTVESDATTTQEDVAESEVASTQDGESQPAEIEPEESSTDETLESEEVATEEDKENATDESVEAAQPESSQEVKEEEEVMPDKLVALTFDDGPNTTVMVEILDILKEEDVKATFYLIGNNITFVTEDVVKRAYEEGHELGNHSQSHQNMSTMDAETIAQEIELVQKKVESLVGERPATFRPPYIGISKLMHDTIELPFIVGVDSKDWDASVSGQERYNNVIAGAQDGAIFLMHCFTGNTETVKVLPAIIKELKAQGYGFVTVSELFELQGVEYEAYDGENYSVLPKQN